MRAIKLSLTFIWFTAMLYALYVGLWPDVGRILDAIKSGSGGRLRWDIISQRGAERIAHEPLAVLGLVGAVVLSVTATLFVWYALHHQKRMARTAESRSASYLVTLGREDMVPIMEMREFWLGIREGLYQRGLGGWWNKMLGTPTYIVWCDLGQLGTPHQAAVYLRVVGDRRTRAAVADALSHLHPSAQVSSLHYPTLPMTDANTRHVWLGLARNSEHQIRTQFDELVDVRAVLHGYLKTDARLQRVEVAYRMRPSGKGWAAAARGRAHRSREQASIGEWRGEQEHTTQVKGMPQHGAIGNWRTKAESDDYGWNVEISISATGEMGEVGRCVSQIAENYFGFFRGDNRFVRGAFQPGPAPLGYPAMTRDRNVLSPAECAAVLHLSKAANLPGLAYATAKYLPANRDLEMGDAPFVRDTQGRIVSDAQGYNQMNWQPASLPPLPPRDAIWRSSALGYNRDHIIGIQRNDRMKGTLVIGPPGVGKSSLLVAVALGDVASGDGVAVIEPHRDLMNDILPRLERRDWGRVVYIDPQELYGAGRAVTINVMEGGSSRERRSLIQNQTVQVIRAMFGTNWEAATRMQSLLHNALGTILEQERHPTLRHIARFMGNAWYRGQLTAATGNPDYRHYWEDYFDPSDERDKQTMIGPVYTRVTKALQNPYSAQVVSSAYSSINLGEVMDKGCILLVNLPGAGKNAGDETMAGVAALILSKLRVEAESRRGMLDKADRRPFYIIVDEAHLIINETVEDLVAQFRKYRLGLTLAFQTLSQLQPDTRAVLAAAMQNKIMFRAEGADTEIASEMMLNSEVLPAEVSSLPNRCAYARLLWKEAPQPVCTLQTLTLPNPPAWVYPPADIEAGRRAARIAHPASSDGVRGALDQVAQTLTAIRRAHDAPDDEARQIQFEALEEQTISALMALNDDDFALVRQVQRARDRHIADWLLENPGAMSEQVALIKEVSILRHSIPQVLITAEVRREEASFAAQQRASGGPNRPTPGGGRGMRPRGSGNQGQPALPVTNPAEQPVAAGQGGPTRTTSPASPTTRRVQPASPPIAPTSSTQRN